MQPVCLGLLLRHGFDEKKNANMSWNGKPYLFSTALVLLGMLEIPIFNMYLFEYTSISLRVKATLRSLIQKKVSSTQKPILKLQIMYSNALCFTVSAAKSKIYRKNRCRTHRKLDVKWCQSLRHVCVLFPQFMDSAYPSNHFYSGYVFLCRWQLFFCWIGHACLTSTLPK